MNLSCLCFFWKWCYSESCFAEMHFSGSSETRVVSQFCWWSLSRSHGCLGHIGDWYYLWLWEFSGIIADDGNPYPRYHWYHHIISQYISCLLKPFHAFQNPKDSPPRSTSEKLTFTKNPIPMWQANDFLYKKIFWRTFIWQVSHLKQPFRLGIPR